VVEHTKVAMGNLVTEATETDTEVIKDKFVGVEPVPKVSKRVTRVKRRVDGSKNYRFTKGLQAARE
jgi:hypothetical protein